MTTGFTNQTNIGRVGKMVEIIDLLKKSADSNKAPKEEIWTVLQPAIDALSALLGASAEPPKPSEPPVAEPASETRPGRQQQPRWADVRQMAQEASLDDLGAALAVYMSRVDELIHSLKKSR